MVVKVINKSNNKLPEYATSMSAGFDLRANLKESVILKAGDRMLVGTGLFIALEPGYEAQVRPRSGLALKHGITVLNAPGTIDANPKIQIKISYIINF